MPEIKIAPSILSADFLHLEQEIKSVEKYADWIQFDVMDGLFVRNISFGQDIVRQAKTSCLKDVHLMIERPERYVKEFAGCGADVISIHAEATKKIPQTLKSISDLGCVAGLALKPKSSEQAFLKNSKYADLALVMTVEPGFGGQKFMQGMLPKITTIRKALPEIDIQVDGGIEETTAFLAAKAGANIFVAGSSIFKSNDRKKAINNIRNAAKKGRKEWL